MISSHDPRWKIAANTPKPAATVTRKGADEFVFTFTYKMDMRKGDDTSEGQITQFFENTGRDAYDLADEFCSHVFEDKEHFGTECSAHSGSGKDDQQIWAEQGTLVAAYMFGRKLYDLEGDIRPQDFEAGKKFLAKYADL